MATNEFIPLISSGVITSTTASKSNESFLAVRSTALRNLDDRNLPVTNPPFSYRTAGRMLDTLKDTRERGVADPSIVRGHIRRSVIDESDPTSKYRLYFMYNPEVIERSFVSYLDQQALDPFNTVFGSKNLVAPPGVLDFTFDMMFDRQIENANGAMPRGALEDFDYFDLVVRGVIPNIGTGDLPDNGVLMVNPRNITVVFSPQLTIQGRPNQAEVVYEKFDHRMTPTRMTIRLSMKAYYIGPAKKDFTFAQSTAAATAQATVPYDDAIKYSVTSENVSYRYFKPPSTSSNTPTSGFTAPYSTPVTTQIDIQTEVVPNNNPSRPPILRPNSAVYSNGKFPEGLLSPIIDGFYLWHPAAAAFMAMYRAAQGANIQFALVDGYRSYEDQETIFHRSAPGMAATPGYSNHGWGLAVDFNRYAGSAWGDTYAWLNAHAQSFNFYQLVIPWEEWHWDWCAGGTTP